MSKTIIVAVDETQLENFQNVVDSLDCDLCMIKIGSVSFNAVSYTHPPSPRDATLSRMPSSA